MAFSVSMAAISDDNNNFTLECFCVRALLFIHFGRLFHVKALIFYIQTLHSAAPFQWHLLPF